MGERAAGTRGPSAADGGPRALRVLPGIGDRRAREIAVERWRRAGDFPVERWHELPGIGRSTQAAVFEYLRTQADGGGAAARGGPLLHLPR